jgi:hypothetical protein
VKLFGPLTHTTHLTRGTLIEKLMVIQLVKILRVLRKSKLSLPAAPPGADLRWPVFAWRRTQFTRLKSIAASSGLTRVFACKLCCACLIVCKPFTTFRELTYFQYLGLGCSLKLCPKHYFARVPQSYSGGARSSTSLYASWSRWLWGANEPWPSVVKRTTNQTTVCWSGRSAAAWTQAATNRLLD